MRAIGGPLSLGGATSQYLEQNHWVAGLTYRYLRADEMYQGHVFQPQFKAGGTNADITIHSIDLTVGYAITKRFDLTLSLPIIDATVDVVSNRLHQSVWGPGDLRLVANYWVLDPQKNTNGNFSFGLGLKMPTGDSNAQSAGGAADFAVQPGDGAWGFLMQVVGFQKIFHNAFLYAAASYLFNPQGQSGTLFTTDPNVRLSIPDSYLARAGLSYLVWPRHGISLSLGGMIEGVPVEDAIGSSEGFRRPGYEMFIEPGIAWDFGKNHLGLNAPVAVDRNREPSVLDRQTGVPGVGAMANFLLVFNYSRRF